jgi:hypothetical protein
MAREGKDKVKIAAVLLRRAKLIITCRATGALIILVNYIFIQQDWYH